jgi:hypothetical protein
MTRRKSIAVFAMVASLVLATGIAAAQSGATVDSSSDQGEYSGPTSPGQVDADGGNVTYANLSTSQTTDNWAGVFGNATGTLVLGDGTDRLFEWDAVADYVFASTGTVDFSSISGGTASGLASNLNYGVVSDNATQTFDDGDTTVDVNGGVTGDTALTYDQSDNEVWETVYLTDGSNDVFAGVTQPYSSETSYAGTDADYQIILPEDNTGSAASFNVYMELQ